MKGYIYNESFQLVGAVDLPKAPGQDNQYMVTSSNITTVKPPKEKEGYVPVFNPETEKWTQSPISSPESE